MATKIYANARFAHRADTKDNWLKYDPVLEKGEPAIVLDGIDGESVKIGDGEHKFSELNYVRGPKGEKGEKGEVNVETQYNPTSENAVSNKAVDEFLNGDEGYMKTLLSTFLAANKYATQNGIAGAVRINAANGIYITPAGYLQTFPAKKSEIEAKTNAFKPIVPSTADYAVYSALKDFIDEVKNATTFDELRGACENYLNSFI